MRSDLTVVMSVFRLKKDLKGLLVVHPAWYIKALITVVKPFIRSAHMHAHAHMHTRTHMCAHTDRYTHTHTL